MSELPKWLEEKRDEQSKIRAIQVQIKQRHNPDLSVFENANRSYIKGFDAAVSLMLEELNAAREALNKISNSCQCETDDRDICFDIAVKALARINERFPK